jgi:UDP:flavonoid glycosyltransferase YjiC (YdhE family)
MNKKSVLFLTTNIRSHILPALYLADLFSFEKEVYFATTDDVSEELIKSNGYKTVPQSRARILLNLESAFIEIYQKRKVNYYNIVKAIYKNDIFTYRQKELHSIIDRINADTVVIDIYNSTDFLVLNQFSKENKVIFFNPMLSIYKVKNFPLVSDGFWMKDIDNSEYKSKKEIDRFIKNPLNFVLNHINQWQKKKILSEVGFPKNNIEHNPNFTMLFKGVPELILAPLELEISNEVKQDWQYYMGLCIRKERVDTELDKTFINDWNSIITSDKKSKILYCSFGTFHSGNFRHIFDFVETLIEVTNVLKDIQLIISVNKFVIEYILSKHVLRSNIHLYSRVPQLKVLEHTDIFITHGGLGSIKESIEYEVPMLVYPIDFNYDQNGNGLKVEYHEIGIRGNINTVDVINLKDNINTLLNKEKYKNNIIKMNKSIKNKYKETNNLLTIKKLML